MRDFRDAKVMAQSLREALGAKQVSVTHSESLELVARALGAADWNTLSALINADTTPTRFIPDDASRRLAEQAAPRTVAVVPPGAFERYFGSYLVGDYPWTLTPALLTVTGDGTSIFYQISDLERVEVHPESQTKLFAKARNAQISFHSDAEGLVTHLVLHYQGVERSFRKLDPAEAREVIDARSARLASTAPSQGTEDVLRRYLVSAANGQPTFDDMTPMLAENYRRRYAANAATLKAWGAPKAIAFSRVDPQGNDVYDVEYQNGLVEWRVTPLRPDGKVSGMDARTVG